MTPFFNKQWIVPGSKWTVFGYDESLYYNERYEFTLQSELPMDVYITSGSIRDNEPNEFNYDAVFKKQTYVKITSDMMGSSPKFAAAVLVKGLDYYNNVTMMHSVKATFMIYNTLTGKAVRRSSSEGSTQTNETSSSEIVFNIPRSIDEIRFEHVLIVIAAVCLISSIKSRKNTPTKKETPGQVAH